MTEKGDPGIAKPTVYIETSVVSYLTGWPSRDLVVAAQQHITREWWCEAADHFELVASQLVVNEASAGDPGAARARLAALETITLLAVTDDAKELTRKLLDTGAVPGEATEDATHIAIAVVNGVDYLVTWNLRHIANAMMQAKIGWVCRQAGYEPTTIGTPDQLSEFQDEEEDG